MQRLIPSRLHDEQGIAMTFVILMTAMLLLLSVALINVVSDDSTQANTSIQRGTALAAAEAGIDNYLSKLVDDNQYYLHDVAAGESTRQSGAVTTAGSCSSTPTPATWTGGTTWTYPNGKDQWCSVGNGYEFNLQVTAPSSGSQVVDIVSTGRKTGTTNNYRALEIQVRPSSVADFLMLTNSNYNVGATATTYGKIYAGENSTGTVKYNINHQGTAYGNLYAEGTVTGNPTLAGTPPAQEYTGAAGTIRAQIKTPIDFSNFTTSLVDIKRAADLNGSTFDLSNPAYNIYKLTFNSSGTVGIQGCKIHERSRDHEAHQLHDALGLAVHRPGERRDLLAGERDDLRRHLDVRFADDHRQLRERPRHRRVEQRHHRRRQPRLRADG